MFDCAPSILATALPAMGTLYWACLVVGGGLLLISSVAGGDADAGIDADIDVDIDVDVDADIDLDHGHAHASALAGWFSIQFLVFFMAMFGLVGVSMTHLSRQESGVVLIASLLSGLAIGQGAHQILRKLRANSGDSTPKPEDYLNKLARVTVTIDGTKKGEVAMRVGRCDRYVPAVARRAEQSFGPGDSVGVVAYREGVAEVVSREEYEFVNEEN